MVKTIRKGLVLVAGLGMMASVAQTGTACGQGLYGATYGDMVQWQATYGGGGFYGCDYPPPRPYCYPGEMQPAPVLKPAYPCRTPRYGRRRGRK